MSTTPKHNPHAEAAIDTLANAFLRWPLPESVCADPCATKQIPGRTGTNLLTFTEARQMMQDIVAPMLAEKGRNP